MCDTVEDGEAQKPAREQFGVYLSPAAELLGHLGYY